MADLKGEEYVPRMFARWDTGELVEVRYPKEKQWQGLSDDDVKAIEEVLGIDKVYIRAVERTLKEKNHG